MLAVALDEARAGLAEGGIPIGAALFTRSGELLGRGHNQRVQRGDPSAHGETDAFRNAGRRRTYRDTVMVTTLSPCWYCSGLIRQFGISGVIIGESRTFAGGADWLRSSGVEVVDLDSVECRELQCLHRRRIPRSGTRTSASEDQQSLTSSRPAVAGCRGRRDRLAGRDHRRARRRRRRAA